MRRSPNPGRRSALGAGRADVSVRRMSLGAGCRYPMSSVARGDGDGRAVSALTRHYAESESPPGSSPGWPVWPRASGSRLGRWWGRGRCSGCWAACGTRTPAATWACLLGAAFPARLCPPCGACGAEAGGGVCPEIERPEVGQRRLGPRRPRRPGTVYGPHRAAVEGCSGSPKSRCSARGSARPAPPRSTCGGVVAAVFDHDGAPRGGGPFSPVRRRGPQPRPGCGREVVGP